MPTKPGLSSLSTETRTSVPHAVELHRSGDRSLSSDFFTPWVLRGDLRKGSLFRADPSVDLFTVYRNAHWRLHSHAHLILSYAKNGNHHVVCNYDRFSGSSCQDKHV